MREQHDKARQLLTDHRDILDRLAMHLYEKETITGEEFMAVLAEKPADLTDDASAASDDAEA